MGMNKITSLQEISQELPYGLAPLDTNSFISQFLGSVWKMHLTTTIYTNYLRGGGQTILDTGDTVGVALLSDHKLPTL
jgi:hypothetical protein